MIVYGDTGGDVMIVLWRYWMGRYDYSGEDVMIVYDLFGRGRCTHAPLSPKLSFSVAVRCMVYV